MKVDRLVNYLTDGYNRLQQPLRGSVLLCGGPCDGQWCEFTLEPGQNLQKYYTATTPSPFCDDQSDEVMTFNSAKYRINHARTAYDYVTEYKMGVDFPAFHEAYAIYWAPEHKHWVAVSIRRNIQGIGDTEIDAINDMFDGVKALRYLGTKNPCRVEENQEADHYEIRRRLGI